MDEKHGLPRPAAAPRAYSFSSRTPRRAPTVASILIISLILLWCFQPALVPRFHRMAASHLPLLGEGGDAKQQHRSGLADNATLVPLEAHIMSKCPDAMDCLQQLILPVMERVAPLVDFKLSFIGETDSNDGVHCKHGEGECLGNVFLLCAQKLYPDPEVALGFSNCMISDYEEIPSRNLIEGCALEHAMDFGKLNDCASEEGEGLDLLRKSVKRSQEKGVLYSCTIRLADDIRCVRDSGEWKDCEGGSKPNDLVRDIKELSNSRQKDGHVLDDHEA